jgi:hypothetical protein
MILYSIIGKKVCVAHRTNSRGQLMVPGVFFVRGVDCPFLFSMGLSNR